ncbi:MAG: PAS domain S-box protein [Salinivirgaceae bacterium]|jgi:PAS domain S-box-containing protein
MRITKKQSVNIDSIGVPILLLTFDKSFKKPTYYIKKANIKAYNFFGFDKDTNQSLNNHVSDIYINKLANIINSGKEEVVQFYNFKNQTATDAIVKAVSLDNKDLYLLTLVPINNSNIDIEISQLVKEMLDVFPVGITVYQNQKIVQINKEMENLTGFSTQKLKEYNTPAFYTCPDYRRMVETVYEKINSQTEPFEFWIISEGGERKYVKNTFYKLANNNNIIVSLLFDFTEQKNTQIELEKRNEEIKTLASNTTAFIFRFNREFVCTNANYGVELITGISPSEMVGKNIEEIGFNKDTLSLLKKYFIESFSERKKRNIEYRFDSIRGERIIEAVLVPETAPNSNTVHSVLFINRDVTAHRNMVDKITQNEKHYRLLANNSTDVIWTMDLKRDILYVSSAVETVLGYKPEEMSTAVFESSFTKESLEELQMVVNDIIKHIKLGEHEKIRKDYRIETLQYRKDRTLRHIEINLNAQTDEYGRHIGIIGTSRDITIRKEAELELIATREKALEADRLKTAFLANMSHEIRTPMNGILGFIDLLSDDDLSTEKRSEYLELINKNAGQLLRLIDDIIDISRIEAGQLTIKNHSTDIIQLLKDTVKTHKEKLKFINKENVEIIFEPQDEELIIDVDPVRFTQIVSNLIENSAKFTEKGNITLSYVKRDHEIEFCIADTGIGLTKENIDYIFDRFRQVDEHDSAKFGGAGLGLSIVKNLVELMKGTIWAKSNDDKGASFYFTLPIKSNVVTVEVPSISQIAQDTTGETVTKNILVVEDEEMNYILIRETLKNEPYKLFWAQDGIDAIEFAKKEKIDLILMDIRLPRMNGYEAAKIIKATHPHISIIAQTAYSNYNDVVTALESGCDDFIVKPLKPKKLKSMIKKYLRDKTHEN